MTARQLAFFRQAESDWAVYRHFASLGTFPPCHELHYLQMCCEKLAKAYFGSDPRTGHAAFYNFILRIAGDPDALSSLGFADITAMLNWQNSVLTLAEAVERLAPSSADRLGLRNPEYPFPRGAETDAPADHPFQAEIYSHLAAQLATGEPPFLDVLGRMVGTMLADAWHE